MLGPDTAAEPQGGSAPRPAIRSRLGTVLVTGTSSGIGRATAAALAARGYHVLAGVRKLGDADELAAASTLIEPVELDITDDAALERLAARLAELPDGLAALVNNAGTVSVGAVELIPGDRWDQVIRTNVLGTINVTRTAIPALLRAKGRIVVVTSPAGKIAFPLYGPYNVSKFALEGFADTLRRELAFSDISVTSVSPGFASTPIFEKGVIEGQAFIDAGYDDPELRARYAELAFGALDAGVDARDNGASPDTGAALIMRALRARRPKARYSGGIENHAVDLITWLLPAKVLDRLVLKLSTTEAR